MLCHTYDHKAAGKRQPITKKNIIAATPICTATNPLYTGTHKIAGLEWGGNRGMRLPTPTKVKGVDKHTASAFLTEAGIIDKFTLDEHWDTTNNGHILRVPVQWNK